MLIKVPLIAVLLYFSFFDWLQNSEFIYGLASDSAGTMVEMCENGIDDDGDGLRDLNDPDCTCDPVVDFYIPNPSFEGTLCCPCDFDALTNSCIGVEDKFTISENCLNAWLNNIDAGADFFHTCANYIGSGIASHYDSNIENNADGNSYLGLFTSAPGQIAGSLIKEYAGVCLNTSLNAGEPYQFELDIGFSTQGRTDVVEMAIFGSQSCANWPYVGSNGDEEFGCPQNDTNRLWIELGTSVVTGIDTWTRTTIQFTPSMNINMIAVGASCSQNRSNDIVYHYIDNLSLFSLADNNVNISISLNGGSPCMGNTDLTFAAPNIASTYQWYKDGVAIVGETGILYTLPGGSASDGEYIVKIENTKGCFLTNPYMFSIAPFFERDTQTICEGQSYFFNLQNLTIAGDYRDTLLSLFNCDSIVDLHLIVSPLISRTLDSISFCEGYQPANFPVTGLYRDTIRYINLCDSLITNQHVTILPNSRSAPILDTICEGEVYFVGTSQFTLPGDFMPMITSSNGCDSIIDLNLTVLPPITTPITLTRCAAETLIYQGEELVGGGPFSYAFSSAQGCDSTVLVAVIDLPDPVTEPEVFEVTLGDSVEISVVADLGAVRSTTWLPHPTLQLSPDLSQVIYTQNNTFLELETTDTSGCKWTDLVEIKVITNYSIFFPTGFTPSDNGLSPDINDYFRPYVEADVEAILNFSVFNRWGDIVYEMPQNIPAMSLNDSEGWNGNMYSSEINAPPGVYIYYCMALFKDGEKRPFTGDVTLIR